MQIAPPSSVSVDCNLRHVFGELFIDTVAALLFAASRSECEKEANPGNGKVTAMAIHLPVPFKWNYPSIRYQTLVNGLGTPEHVCCGGEEWTTKVPLNRIKERCREIPPIDEEELLGVNVLLDPLVVDQQSKRMRVEMAINIPWRSRQTLFT